MSILSNLRAVQSGSQSAKKIYQMFKKWMERARGVNTHYFILLFGRCSQNVVQVWGTNCESVLKVFRKYDRPNI